MKLFFIKRPCDGLVISGYSKSLPDTSWEKYLAKDIDPYKKFKKMYTVGSTDEFKGKIKLDRVVDTVKPQIMVHGSVHGLVHG